MAPPEIPPEGLMLSEVVFTEEPEEGLPLVAVAAVEETVPDPVETDAVEPEGPPVDASVDALAVTREVEASVEAVEAEETSAVEVPAAEEVPGFELETAPVVPGAEVDGGTTDEDEAAALVTVRSMVFGGATGTPWSLTHWAALPKYQLCVHVNPGNPAEIKDFPQVCSTATQREAPRGTRNP